MNRTIRIALTTLMVFFAVVSEGLGQKISTSPTRMNFRVSPGASGTGAITISNNSGKRQAFQVTFGDFQANAYGKSEFVKKGDVDRSCADWLTASPAVFELNTGETQDVSILLNVPADSAALFARWAVAYVRLAAPEVEGQDGESNQLKVKVNQSYRFGVYIFQTPPNATKSKGEILAMNYEEDVFGIQMKNDGETFLRCNSYIELTSLKTGQTKRITTKGFTMLPAGVRNTLFKIPQDFPPGPYSVLGVMDYGNRDEVEAAEMEIEILKKEN